MDLTGTWFNELGSTMVIDQVANGVISGSYTTAVSSTGCAQGSFTLVGSTDTDSGGEGVAFSVCWVNSASQCASVTAWSGQAQTTNGEDQILAFWLLTVESPAAQDWYATHVGQDVFTRAQPNDEQIASKSRMLRRSHP
ncbi:MAG: avidin/streptavidin family protein [Pyrinomonadaceae bacterium]